MQHTDNQQQQPANNHHQQTQINNQQAARIKAIQHQCGARSCLVCFFPRPWRSAWWMLDTTAQTGAQTVPAAQKKTLALVASRAASEKHWLQSSTTPRRVLGWDRTKRHWQDRLWKLTSSLSLRVRTSAPAADRGCRHVTSCCVRAGDRSGNSRVSGRGAHTGTKLGSKRTMTTISSTTVDLQELAEKKDDNMKFLHFGSGCWLDQFEKSTSITGEMSILLYLLHHRKEYLRVLSFKTVELPQAQFFVIHVPVIMRSWIGAARGAVHRGGGRGWLSGVSVLVFLAFHQLKLPSVWAFFDSIWLGRFVFVVGACWLVHQTSVNPRSKQQQQQSNLERLLFQQARITLVSWVMLSRK